MMQYLSIADIMYSGHAIQTSPNYENKLFTNQYKEQSQMSNEEAEMFFFLCQLALWPHKEY